MGVFRKNLHKTMSYADHDIRNELLQHPDWATELDVEVLNLNNRQLGDEGVAVIAEALGGNTHIHTLWLNNNQIGRRGSEALGTMLKTNITLRRLYIRDNHIDLQALNEGLRKNWVLKILDLGNNKITSIAGLDCHVKRLYLGDNKIHDLTPLQDNMTLNTLSLKRNPVHLDPIMPWLQSRPWRMICLDQVPVSDKTLEQLCHVSFQCLSLTGCQLQDEARSRLDQMDARVYLPKTRVSS